MRPRPPRTAFLRPGGRGSGPRFAASLARVEALPVATGLVFRGPAAPVRRPHAVRRRRRGSPPEKRQPLPRPPRDIESHRHHQRHRSPLLKGRPLRLSDGHLPPWHEPRGRHPRTRLGASSTRAATPSGGCQKERQMIVSTPVGERRQITRQGQAIQDLRAVRRLSRHRDRLGTEGHRDQEQRAPARQMEGLAPKQELQERDQRERRVPPQFAEAHLRAQPSEPNSATTRP